MNRQSTLVTGARLIASVAVASAAVIGCHHDKPPATVEITSAPAPAPGPEPTAIDRDRIIPDQGSLGLSEQIVKLCKIDMNSVASAPKFDFDESALLVQDRAVLQQLATCVTSGPLKGRSLQLVGRADPRGEEEYNMALGARRADAVDSFLVGLGVPASNLTPTSRGKLDALGTNEDTWALDRRVDIVLKP